MAPKVQWHDAQSLEKSFKMYTPYYSRQDLYKEGVEAYNDEDYRMTIDLIERALQAYFEEAERCDAMCESSVGNEVTQDFYMMMAGTW